MRIPCPVSIDMHESALAIIVRVRLALLGLVFAGMAPLSACHNPRSLYSLVDDTWLSAENSPGRTIVRFRASLGDIGFPADDNVLVRSDNHPVFPTP